MFYFEKIDGKRILKSNFIKDYNDYEINVLLCAFTQQEYNEALKQF